MKKLLALLFLINISFIVEADKLSINDLEVLATDQIYLDELVLLNNLMNEGINAVYEQNTQQSAMNDIVSSYLSNEEISNEELWEALDYIKENSNVAAIQFREKVLAISMKSASTNPNARIIYSQHYDFLNKIISYSDANAKLTSDLILVLEKGEIEKYDYLSAKGQISSSDWLKISAEIMINSASRIPSSTVIYNMSMLEGYALYALADAQKIHGLFMLDELDNSNFYKIYDEYQASLQNFYDKKLNSNLRRSISKSSRDIKNLLAESEPDFHLSAQKFFIEAENYIDGIKDNLEAYSALTSFYKKNINNLNSIYSDVTLSLKHESLIENQHRANDLMTKLADDYAKSHSKLIILMSEYSDLGI